MNPKNVLARLPCHKWTFGGWMIKEKDSVDEIITNLHKISNYKGHKKIYEDDFLISKGSIGNNQKFRQIPTMSIFIMFFGNVF